MFNKFVWKNYLKSGGDEIVKFFKESFEDNFSEEYATKICELHREYCPDSSITEDLADDMKDLAKSSAMPEYPFSYACYPIIRYSKVWRQLDSNPNFKIEHKNKIESVLNLFREGMKTDGVVTDKQYFTEFSSGIPYYTTFLTILFSDLFIPYYFQCNFNVFQQIATEFEIELPPIPLKKDYRGRFYYYGEICEALHKFRRAHGMSLYELCAFLYDFAPQYIGGVNSYIIQDLPEPKSVFLTGGAQEDEKLSENSASICRWQCSPDTRAGDLVVMYLRTPISAVDSVWRSVSIGFNDPFFYYYRCTYIARPHKLKRISQKQLQEDAVFKELPIIKKNMQGVNGVELYPSVYNHLIDLAESDLPRLEDITADTGYICSEKDVENELIKPLLKKLGYKEQEYQQQLYMEIGNHNHALIPDFVIHPVVSTGHQSADFLVEAKLSIPSTKLLEEAKTQARGYAKLLSAKYAVVASKEGIWITKVDDDYSRDILSLSWEEFKKRDKFHDVEKLIGNGKM